jgi:pimeloyl-ACP methyl ester carboxylesterase
LSALKQITVNDTVLNYSDVGSGVPFIFVHGAAASCNHVMYLQDDLRTHARVISYSQRFHLPNDPCDRGVFGPDQHAKDLIALMDALQIEKAVLFGHSYGALVATTAAILAPEKVIHLFLAEPTLPLLVNNNPEYTSIVEVRKKTFDEIKRAFLSGNPANAVKQLLDYAIGGKGFNTLPEEIRRDMIANAAALYQLVFNQEPPTISSPENIAKLKMPVTILLGEKCTPMYTAVCLELKKLISTVSIHHFRDVAHDLIYNAAEDCAQVVINECKWA